MSQQVETVESHPWRLSHELEGFTALLSSQQLLSAALFFCSRQQQCVCVFVCAHSGFITGCACCPRLVISY